MNTLGRAEFISLAALMALCACSPADQTGTRTAQTDDMETIRFCSVSADADIGSESPLPAGTAMQPGIAALRTDDAVIPVQLDDLDGDGVAEVAFTLLDLSPGESVAGTLVSAPDDVVQRATAGLIVGSGGIFDEDGKYSGGTSQRVSQIDVPEAQVQDSGWPMLEGPFWESDLAGYRVYLDDRNLTDAFGKRIHEMVLADITGNYHALSDWGADVLKVGVSLGIGSPAIVNQVGWQPIAPVADQHFRVVADGPLRAVYQRDYLSVRVDESNLDVLETVEVRGGRRWSERRLETSDNIPLITGIVAHEAGGELVTGELDGVFYAYTYGPQADQGDGLGLAVIVRELYFAGSFDDVSSHAFRLQSQLTNGSWYTEYRFMIGWELGVEAVPDAATFDKLVRRAAAEYAAEHENAVQTAGASSD